MREQCQRGCRHIGNHSDDDIGVTFERAGQHGEQIAAVGLHAVGGRAGNGTLVEVGRDDPRTGAARGQDLGHRAGACAEINGYAVGWKALDGATREGLALPAWNVDTRIDADLQTTE